MRAALSGVFLLVAWHASAEVYRWVDPEGTVHYSNATPPAGVDATKVDVEAKRLEPTAAPRERISVASADVYRWLDASGTVHYSNKTPPGGVEARKLDIDAGPRAPVTESAECYTARCESDRNEQRLARHEIIAARLAAERAAAKPLAPRGLESRRYAAIRHGMSEAEFLEIAGKPDLLLLDSRTVRTYAYYPTAAHPSTTVVTLVHGRVSEVERLRPF